MSVCSYPAQRVATTVNKRNGCEIHIQSQWFRQFNIYINKIKKDTQVLPESILSFIAFFSEYSVLINSKKISFLYQSVFSVYEWTFHRKCTLLK